MKEAPPPRPSRVAFRKLSDEEIELWAEVAKSVARRRGATLPALSRPKPPPAPAPAPATPVGSKTAEKTPPKPSPLPLAPIERRMKRDLSRGRAVVDDALDLHGLNQAEAHHALRSFLFAAQARGAKLVIVVTGKGKAGAGGDVLDRRARSAAPPRPALAARAGHARGRARLRGGRPHARRLGRALCANPQAGRARLSDAALTCPRCDAREPANPHYGLEINLREQIDVLGLGNSLVDILPTADDEFLSRHEMAKGAMTLIDEDRAEASTACWRHSTIMSGGSAANTIVGVASLGVSSAYIGKVKHDRARRYFSARHPATGRRLRHPRRPSTDRRPAAASSS